MNSTLMISAVKLLVPYRYLHSNFWWLFFSYLRKPNDGNMTLREDKQRKQEKRKKEVVRQVVCPTRMFVQADVPNEVHCIGVSW